MVTDCLAISTSTGKTSPSLDWSLIWGMLTNCCKKEGKLLIMKFWLKSTRAEIVNKVGRIFDSKYFDEFLALKRWKTSLNLTRNFRRIMSRIQKCEKVLKYLRFVEYDSLRRFTKLCRLSSSDWVVFRCSCSWVTCSDRTVSKSDMLPLFIRLFGMARYLAALFRERTFTITWSWRFWNFFGDFCLPSFTQDFHRKKARNLST